MPNLGLWRKGRKGHSDSSDSSGLGPLGRLNQRTLLPARSDVLTLQQLNDLQLEVQCQGGATWRPSWKARPTPGQLIFTLKMSFLLPSRWIKMEYTHTHTYIYIYTYVHMYIYIYIYHIVIRRDIESCDTMTYYEICQWFSMYGWLFSIPH